MAHSKVKNVALADFGRHEIGVAESKLSVLMSCRIKYGPSKPLEGSKITLSRDVTAKTAVLVETLRALGAELRWCSRNSHVTEDHVAAAVARDSATVFAWKDQTVKEYWSCAARALEWGPGGPNLIVDDGGDLILLIHVGVYAEKVNAETGAVPDLASASTSEFQIVLTIIRDGLEADPWKYHKMKENIVGLLMQQNGNLSSEDQVSCMYGLSHSVPSVACMELFATVMKQDGGHVIVTRTDLLLPNHVTSQHNFEMSGSFTKLVVALVELWTEKSSGKYKNEVYVFPKHLDEEVAALHLEKVAAGPTYLSSEQADHICIQVDGPDDEAPQDYGARQCLLDCMLLVRFFILILVFAKMLVGLFAVDK